MEIEDMKQDELHAKAIRLLEGGSVEVEGLVVKLGMDMYIFDPCFGCEMDSLCHLGNDICNLCMECDTISHRDCFLFIDRPEPVG